MGRIIEGVKILLDKERTLRFDFNACVAYERETGQSISALKDNPGFTSIRALIWAGLLHEEPKLTIERAGAMLDLADLEVYSEAIAEAMTRAFTKSGSGTRPEASDPNAEGSTGAPSGVTGASTSG